ncbi:hypothetical protein EDD18DRAFT_1349500 [Armillaria luteobubalina]|uniref:Zn(2)-C6 fungal-type domain-containing protein n=1 Tax=Armillaria luteobubalina TaxID=153913 RepID=A0AA39UZD9_9AGAR|nr:hypothetical protein EDD18DRAFT_1349500 [Armillaria luteobubalina]
MAEPTDPKELAIVNAQDEYETSSTELDKLITSLLPQDADVAAVDLWVIDAKIHWETCTQNWHTAKVTSLEWRKLEYAFLEVFMEVPEDLVVYSCGEYNKLAKHARLFNMPVASIPMSQMPSKQLAPKDSTPSSIPPIALARTHTATPAVVPLVPQMPSIPSPVVAPPPSTTTTLSVVVPLRESLPIRPRPIFKKKTTAVPDKLSMVGRVFALDVTSPLHPDLVALVKTGLPKGVTPSEGSAPSSQWLQAVNAASHRQVLLGPNPIPEGSIASSSRKRTPLFFPGTDDKEEIETPKETAKGKEKEVVPSTNEDEEDFQSQETLSGDMDVDEDEYQSPPPTKIAWRYRSPIPSVPSAPPPITVSEVRPHHTIHDADPNSVLFKLLGAPPVSTKLRKGSQKKPKFNNPPLPPPKDIADEGTMWAKRLTKKASKDKGIKEVPPSDIVPTKANCPCGPSRLRAPPATICIQIGGFGEEVPADYKAVKNGLKSIGVLVVSRDFGKFVEVDKALWNKKIALFVGEQYVKPCDTCHRKKTQCRKFLTNSVICIRCHYAKLPCLVNGTKALNPLRHYHPQEYESINAFKSAMTTLDQHTTTLEDIVINFMAGVDALSHLQGAKTRVEEVVEDEDEEGYDADEVAEGEPGPSRKWKWSGK